MGSEQSTFGYTVLVGVTFIALTPFAVKYVDSCGRKVLLLAGGAGMSLSMFVLAFLYSAFDEATGDQATLLGYGCVACVLSFVAFFR
jgi:hypothetical protein